MTNENTEECHNLQNASWHIFLCESESLKMVFSGLNCPTSFSATDISSRIFSHSLLIRMFCEMWVNRLKTQISYYFCHFHNTCSFIMQVCLTQFVWLLFISLLSSMHLKIIPLIIFSRLFQNWSWLASILLLLPLQHLFHYILQCCTTSYFSKSWLWSCFRCLRLFIFSFPRKKKKKSHKPYVYPNLWWIWRITCLCHL